MYGHVDPVCAVDSLHQRRSLLYLWSWWCQDLEPSWTSRRARQTEALRYGMGCVFIGPMLDGEKGGSVLLKVLILPCGCCFLNMIYRTLSKIIKIYWELLMSNLLKVGCLWFCHSCFYVKYHATIRLGFWQTPQEVEENIDRWGSRVRGVAMKPPDGWLDGPRADGKLMRNN